MNRSASIDVGKEDARSNGAALVDRIRETWSEILGVDAVEPDDDFFELGGHSLIAASAVSCLSERLGIDVPTDALFDAPTPQEMADVIAELPGNPEDRACVRASPFHPSWVIPLQRSGQGRPVFVFPAGRDEMRALAREARLAALVGRTHPFWGLRRDDPLLDPARENGLPALADEYARQLQRMQGDGPFLLFGICVGGYFAWETARSLLAMGAGWPASSFSKSRCVPISTRPCRASPRSTSLAPGVSTCTTVRRRSPSISPT